MTTKSFRGRNLTSLSGFKGVDFSSSPLDVDAHRASDMENFISDFGILRKRNGFQQMREFSDKDGNRFSVCGIFHYKTDEVSHMIVHAGDRFFRLTENGYERIGADIEGLTATRSEAYMQRGRMYIVGCGDFLVYGSFDNGETYELRSVYDGEGTYIPKTTINIGGEESMILDDVNLLTPRRRNTLGGVVIREDAENYYTSVNELRFLDTQIEMLSKVTVKVIESGELLTFEDVQDARFDDASGIRAGYRHIDTLGNIMMVFDDEGKLPTGSFSIKAQVDGSLKRTFTCSGGIIKDGVAAGSYTVDGPILTLSFDAFLHTSIADAGLVLDVGGYVVDVPTRRKLLLANGTACVLNYLKSWVSFSFMEIGLSASRLSDISYGDGEDVFEVTFYAAEAEEEGVIPYRERVRRCRFGTLFGVDGASDRLFLSGNPLLKNAEFFSEMDDFTYFPDTYTTAIGSDDIAIVGYMRLSDGTLSVFKEKRDMGDATIYYRSSYYKQYTNESGELDRIDPVFPTVAGNMGEAMISRFASKDFGGDKLFLSENGVFGVVLSENITIGERYSRERSRMVNARLTREKDLSQAVAIVYKGKYYLAVNGHVYVADSRYRSTRADSVDSAWGYEWYFLSGVPARVLAEVDGALWFGTADGRLCRFDNEYTDRTYTLYGAADLTANSVGITVNSRIEPAPRVGDRFLTNDKLYGVAYKGFAHAEDGRIYHEELSVVARMAEGERLYVDGAPEGSVLENGALYELRDIDPVQGSFSLYKDGALVPIDTHDFLLLCPLWSISLDVTEVDGSHFKVGRYGETMELVTKGVSVLTGKLWHESAVCARWVSAVTDLGASMASKNLHRISVTCEPTVSGKLAFGYNTRMAVGRLAAPGTTVPFSFEAFDFSSFSFETGFASSYTARIFERNVNYLALAVESNTATGCALNSLEVFWSYNRALNSGLR